MSSSPVQSTIDDASLSRVVYYLSLVERDNDECAQPLLRYGTVPSAALRNFISHAITLLNSFIIPHHPYKTRHTIELHLQNKVLGKLQLIPLHSMSFYYLYDREITLYVILLYIHADNIVSDII